jgi:DNA-binding NarL/FixJ family response regulator
MVAVAIFSRDPVRRRKLHEGFPEDPAITVVAAVADPALVWSLIGRNQVDAVIADAPSLEQLSDWRTHGNQPALVVLADAADGAYIRNMLAAGARAIVPLAAGCEEIVTAVKAVIAGLAVLHGEFLPALLADASFADEPVHSSEGARARLTPRELEVLAAMADGASNKAIALRLGISVHTVKFHVAAILARLQADSRTEAVMKAAQLGLVML